MKLKDLEKLKPGDFVKHKRYGLCIVDEKQVNNWGSYFGLTIRPVTIQGYNTLVMDSGVIFNRLLEDSKRLILEKVENAVVPKLIFKTKTGFDVHDWIIPGEVSDKGKFSSVKIQEFKSIADALVFAGEFENKEQTILAIEYTGLKNK